MTADRVDVLDQVTGRGTHDVTLYWHLGPAAVWDEDSATAEVAGTRLTLELPHGATCEYVPGGVAPLGIAARSHNIVFDAPCLIIRQSAVELPVELRTRIEL